MRGYQELPTMEQMAAAKLLKLKQQTEQEIARNTHQKQPVFSLTPANINNRFQF